MAIEKGNKVKVHYVGTLDDGTQFDNSIKRGEPLEFEVGAGQVISGFDEAVLGMDRGDEKEFRLESDDAYGPRNDEAVRDFPRDQFPEGHTPQEGMMVGMTLPDGRQIPALITDVSDDTVTLDLNHPLAGKALNFKIEIVEC